MQLLFAFWLIATLALVIIAYLRLGRLKRALWRRPEERPQSVEPVSVIIAARNEAENLRQFLPLVLEQEHPQFEVVVVDDGSTDQTTQVLDDFQEKYPQIKVLKQNSSGKKTALSKGVAHAQHQALVFTDADCRPASPYWLQHMASHLEKSDLVLGYGALEAPNNFVGGLSKWESLQTAFHYYAAAIKGQPYMGVGRNLAYRKDVFTKVKGFEPHREIASGDDDLFINSLPPNIKTAVVFHPEAFTYSEAPLTLAKWWQQKRRHFTTSWHYSWPRKLSLAGEGFTQLSFYLLLPIVLPTYTEPVVFMFLMRYVATLVWGVPLAKHFKGQREFFTFPLWEMCWAIFTTLIHLQNLIFGSRKAW